MGWHARVLQRMLAQQTSGWSVEVLAARYRIWWDLTMQCRRWPELAVTGAGEVALPSGARADCDLGTYRARRGHHLADVVPNA